MTERPATAARHRPGFRLARITAARPPRGPGAAGWSALQAALRRLGLGPLPWGLVLVGGAAGLAPSVKGPLAELLSQTLGPLLARSRGIALDGGTASGVMALMGQSRRDNDDRFPLLGVAAEGTVALTPESALSAQARHAGRAVLEPSHSHQLLVPGDSWGDEVPWLAATASALIPQGRSLTLVCGGGAITRADVAASLCRRRLVVLLRGSGGTADSLAQRINDRPSRSGLLRVLPLADAADGLPALLAPMIAPGPTR